MLRGWPGLSVQGPDQALLLPLLAHKDRPHADIPSEGEVGVEGEVS